ncbi:MAG: hypothetical protein HY819_07925 [Acidobacteria bacterium]|nr:hypothetical protein [Acidobacteriota bacterium]
MNISESMIRYYLRNITMGWFDPLDEPPEHVTGYYECVQEMKLHALSHDDLEALKLGFEWLLANPEIDCTKFSGGRYPYEPEEVREIIHYAWKTIWPDAAPITAESTKDTKLVSTTLDEWWESREHKPGQKKVDAKELFNNKLRGNLLG